MRRVLLLACLGLCACAPPASAGTVPSGFQETTAFSGLTNPTVVRFAPDGRVFVAEKSGLIKVFDGFGDTTPTVFADLRTQVHNFWDRGLLGMSLDFNWNEYPWVYVLYTRDAEPGGSAPRWGTAGATSDPCPSPPGPTGDGCVVSGRISRLVVSGDGSVREDPLVTDWCQQYPSHSVGSLETDPWGGLYASGGDGASFTFTDYGQDGSPVNPCGDPPGSPGSVLTPPTAEGGALRSQDLRTRSDPATLDGSVIRIDPRDGSGIPWSPLGSSPDPNERRILATGLRNPFRFTLDRYGELWVGDVGWNDWEEINNFTADTLPNFGWPCYEGTGRQGGYDSANLNICEDLYGAPTGTVKPPFYAYNHAAKVVPGETCPTGSSSIAGMRFYEGSTFPSAYSRALFFADYSRDCIWAMRAGADGRPNPGTIETFDAGASNPVFLEIGPDGALYYADFDGGRIQRVQFSATNQPPVAVATASPRTGSPPLNVQFDGRGSSDPDGDPLTYAWDLDADGQYDDSTSSQPTFTYTQPGSYNASLRVSDGRGGTSTAPVTIDVGNTPPVPTITSPTSSTTWDVGQTIAFAGSAGDPEQGPLPASSLDWDLTVNHCPSNCHAHPIQSFPDRASGSFAAPDHEYPSTLELRLTATDAGGLSASKTVILNPNTVNLTFTTSPSGLQLAHNGVLGTTTFIRTVIQASNNSISAPSPQTANGRTYDFRSWSDGGAQTHNVTAPTTSTGRSYKATYRRR